MIFVLIHSFEFFICRQLNLSVHICCEIIIESFQLFQLPLVSGIWSLLVWKLVMNNRFFGHFALNFKILNSQRLKLGSEISNCFLMFTHFRKTLNCKMTELVISDKWNFLRTDRIRVFWLNIFDKFLCFGLKLTCVYLTLKRIFIQFFL